MSLVVCKFGGTSVASPERIKMVANKLIAKKKAGDDVVAAVELEELFMGVCREGRRARGEAAA